MPDETPEVPEEAANDNPVDQLRGLILGVDPTARFDETAMADARNYVNTTIMFVYTNNFGEILTEFTASQVQAEVDASPENRISDMLAARIGRELDRTMLYGDASNTERDLLPVPWMPVPDVTVTSNPMIEHEVSSDQIMPYTVGMRLSFRGEPVIVVSITELSNGNYRINMVHSPSPDFIDMASTLQEPARPIKKIGFGDISRNKNASYRPKRKITIRR